MTARILATTTAFPGTAIPQDRVFEEFYRDLYADLPNAAEIFTNTRVRRRYMAWDPRVTGRGAVPGLAARMRGWEEHVLELGRACLPALLDRADRVGTFVMASCTGYAGPTPELRLAGEFGLDERIRRTFVGHMGCYAAFNALKVGLDAVAARPDEQALVLCAEVCSVHLRTEVNAEQAVVHALFGDAAAGLLLASGDSGSGPVVVRTHTRTSYATQAAMTWTVCDESFRMTLSPYVPAYIAAGVNDFVEELIGPAGLSVAEVRYWGIHPGGPKIIDVVGERLGLSQDELAPSAQVLAEYGNCSSATILLILDGIIRAGPRPDEYGVLMAFGPGLTMESALVRF